MTDVERHRSSRRRRSRKKGSSRRRRRTIKVLGWGFVGLVGLSVFVMGVIYLVLSMRGEGAAVPTTTPVRTGLPPD